MAFLALIPKPLLYGAVGLVVGAAALAGVYAYAHHAGRMAERQAILERSVGLLRERNRTDDEVSRFDELELCNALGGIWMPSDRRCE